MPVKKVADADEEEEEKEHHAMAEYFWPEL